MTNQYFYSSDVGSIKLIHQSGAEILLSNHYGDGSFKFYVFNTKDELKKHVNGRYDFVEESLWLNQSGWKVMSYDCYDKYSYDGVELKKYTRIYRKDRTFFFVTGD